MNILFVTSELEIFAASMYAAGRSGGCGYPVATQWQVTDARPATDAEKAENAALVAAMTSDVLERRYWFAPPGGKSRWAIRADVLVHARIGIPATGEREWGRTHYEFFGVTT
jgi:hypothetical protein